MNKIAANIIFAEYMGMEQVPFPERPAKNQTSCVQNPANSAKIDNYAFIKSISNQHLGWKGDWYTKKLLKENVAPLASGPQAPVVATEDLRFTEDWQWLIPVWGKFKKEIQAEINRLETLDRTTETTDTLHTMNNDLDRAIAYFNEYIDTDNIELAYAYLLTEVVDLSFYNRKEIKPV